MFGHVCKTSIGPAACWVTKLALSVSACLSHFIRVTEPCGAQQGTPTYVHWG